jgi:hypothetical protein
MSKQKITYDAELSDNGVHKHGGFIAKIIDRARDGLIDKILKRSYVVEFPAEVQEAAEWEVGHELEITVENKDIG